MNIPLQFLILLCIVIVEEFNIDIQEEMKTHTEKFC